MRISITELTTDELARIRERFWERVDRSGGCWIWTGPIKSNGYGCASYGRQRTGQAHRLAFELAYGPILDERFVCHNCPGGDQKLCVRPDHLWLGTNSENIRDAVSKGTAALGDRHGMRLHPERRAIGERHGQAKLTVAQVLLVRASLAAGATQRAVGMLVGLDPTTIGRIARREIWRHVA